MKKTKTKPQPGDRILVRTKQGKKARQEQGILLESHEPGIVLLKLSSGYNLGLKKKDIVSMKVLEKAKPEDNEEKKIKSNGKPRIEIIMTGGTISSSLDVKTGGVKWLTSPSSFFKFYPEIFNIVDIKISNPFMKSSENMSSEDWIKISRLVARALNDPNVKGVIITHGTDFLHYTSAALSFMLQNLKKPVVLTYSQRSTDRGSSDARLNLLCAAQAAISNIAEVMLVGHASTNDDFCYALPGTNVYKLHSSRRDTFRPINDVPIAKIWPDRIESIGEHKKREKSKSKVELDAVFQDKVSLLKFYPGQDPKILDFYSKQGYKGIVIEMSGLGHVITEGKKSWMPKLKSLIAKGVIVCAAPQTLYGRLDPLVYSPGRELQRIGVIYLQEMLSSSALVKLGWVLGHKEIAKNKEKVREMMLHNFAGEIGKRLLSETFLF